MKGRWPAQNLPIPIICSGCVKGVVKMADQVEEFMFERWGRSIKCWRVIRETGLVEIFHLNKFGTGLKRGLPNFPWPSASHVTRPLNVLTLAEAEWKTGLRVHELRQYIREGRLAGNFKKWRNGNWHREAWFVTEEALDEFVRRKVVEHYAGRLNWDIDAKETLSRNERKPAQKLAASE